MYPLIPYPNQIQFFEKNTYFSNFKIEIEPKFIRSIQQFEKDLNKKLLKNENEKVFLFQFIINKKYKKEQYSLQINQEHCLIEAKSANGFFYACKTLSQLLFLHTPNQVKELEIPCLEINDKPKYAFRSFMIDEVRHFFGKDEIKKIIDLMADLKFNYFHWHLSDDQGFRIHFKEFEKLKTISSKRNKTKINGMDSPDFDETPYEFCYEVNDIREIIEYAKERFIEIIPEIDLPGHTTAIVAAYPELHCLHKHVEVATDFGVFKEILCPSKQETLDFTKRLLKALCSLFKESKYIHIGGDEVNVTNWQSCPDCQRKLKELQLDDFKLLQQNFANEIANYLQSLGKKVISWHDGIHENTNKDVILQYWTWEMDKERIDIMNTGRTSIYSPCSQFYFNDPYAELPLKTTYTRKITLYGLTRTGQSAIYGVEGCIWSEWIDSNELLEVLILPRLHALSEKAWTKNSQQNFKDFLIRLEAYHSILDFKGFSYASTKLALAKGKQYRDKIAKAFRANDKKVEFKLYQKQLKKK